MEFRRAWIATQSPMNSREASATFSITPKPGIHSTLVILLTAALIAAGQLSCLAQAGTAQPKAGNSSVLLQQGLTLASQGQFARAQVVLEQAEQLSPENVEILTTLGKVKARIGENASATALFRKVVALRPNSARAHLDLAISLADQSELQAALQQVDTAIKLAPGSGMARLNRARLLADLNQPQAAKQEYAEAKRLSPSNPDIYFNWALLEQKSGNYAKESSLLRTLIQLQPHNTEAYILLARSLDYQSKQSEAIQYWRKTLALAPNSEEAAYNLWQAQKKNNPAEAARMRQRFLALRRQANNLNEAKNLGNQAYVAMQHHQWPVAIQTLQHAIALCGQCQASPNLYKDLGLAYCHAQKMAECKKYLHIALKLNPSDPDILRALSIANRQ